MNESLVEILCILDRSGSMETIQSDAIGGFNAFIQAQREAPGEALVSLVLFDNAYEMLFEGLPLAEVPPLTSATFVPRGSTALLDAIGKTIDSVRDRHAAMPEAARPAKVLVAIVTDGEENASKLFTRDLIFQEIKALQADAGWEFLFLAANQDAIAAGGSLGIGASSSINFSADKRGTASAFKAASARTLVMRAGPSDPPDSEE